MKGRSYWGGGKGSAKASGPTPAGDSARTKSSSGNLRASAMYRPPEWLGRGSSNWTLQTVAQPLHRQGLRRRLRVALIVAALGPVSVVSFVAVALIFSSVEQGIKFEAERGLQVARGLFLGQVQEVAAGAAALGADPELLGASAASDRTKIRARLGALSGSRS